MDVDAYLQRIEYAGRREPSPETLRSLIAAHLRRVPFENLSAWWGEEIALREDWLFDKMVTRRRGGFCYELNGLFAALLREMGFDVQLLGAEVMGADGLWGPPFDHMALLVSLAEPRLVDVGFGDSFVNPLRLEVDLVREEGGRAYRIRPSGERLALWRRNWEGEWEPQYRFDLRPYELDAYSEMCRFHNSSPESPLVQRRVCSRLTKQGRVTLTDDKLVFTGLDGSQEEQAVAEEAWEGVLADWFDVRRESGGSHVEESRR